MWREPPEESVDLYPGLVVKDSRVTGSITTGRSRLPLWAFMGTAVMAGWAEVESGWEPSQYGWDGPRAAEFINQLLEARGEFGRLLCVLANAERLEDERPADPPWWEMPDMRQPVIDQLKRCLAALE